MTSFRKCPRCGQMDDYRSKCSCGYVSWGTADSANDSTSTPAARIPQRAIIDSLGKMLGAHTDDADPKPLGGGKRFFFLFIGLILLAVFGGIAGFSIYAFVQQANSDNWIPTDAKIITSQVHKKIERDSRGRRRAEYSALVLYKYTVEGKDYESKRLGFGFEQNYSSSAEKIATRYTEGQNITVYRDPSDPESSVLERTVLFATYVHLILGLSVAMIMLRWLLVALTPIVSGSNSRWLPWSHRFTWPDLLFGVGLIIGGVLWVPMMLGF